jgi:hypothetical protein
MKKAANANRQAARPVSKAAGLGLFFALTACVVTASFATGSIVARQPSKQQTDTGLRQQHGAVAEHNSARKDGSAGAQRFGFVVTYFYYAMYQGDDACPAGTNPMVTTADFLKSLPDAERQRLLLPENKRELYRKTVERGPNGENLCAAPWAVSDAPMRMLEGDRNHGLDLDGWKGTGSAPPGVCPQRQYVSEDGKDGIDNQLGRVYACINGLRQKGTLEPYFTQAMRDGMWSMLIDVSGVQDRYNDPEVTVDVYAGAEPMVKDASGKILTGASLSPLPAPRYHRRLQGRIINGVLKTDPVKDMVMPDLMSKSQPDTTVFDSRFELTLLPDGSAKGLLGGYRSIDTLFSPNADAGEGEGYMGYRCEQLYHALHKYADGGRDPKTGKCNLISLAYKIEAVPAFIVHPAAKSIRTFSDAR